MDSFILLLSGRLNFRVVLLFLGGTFGNIGFGMQDHLIWQSVEQIINNRLSVFVRRFSNKEQS